MVKNIINKSEYAEIVPAYIRNSKQYYHLNINPQEIADSDMYVVLSHTYDHYPTKEDKDKLYADYLALCKKVKVAEIDRYDKSEHVNGFYLAGQLAWLPKADRVGLINSINIEKAAGQETTTLYLNGVALTIGVDTALQMLYALELYALACYRVTEQHKIAIAGLTTIEEVENYDCTQGYPEKPHFEV